MGAEKQRWRLAVVRVGWTAVLCTGCFSRVGYDPVSPWDAGDPGAFGDTASLGDPGSAGDPTPPGDLAPSGDGRTNAAPVVTLVGAASRPHLLGDAFTDPGATATDAEDGDLTGRITVQGTVVVDIAGRYELRYRVTDSDGNAAEAVRHVRVAPFGIDHVEVRTTGDAIMISATLVASGLIHYVIFDELPPVRMTAADVVTWASLPGVEPNRLGGGIVSAEPYPTGTFGRVGLGATSPDFVYLVAEGPNGLQGDDDVFAFYRTRGRVRRFHETQTEAVYDGAAVGTLVRYDIFLPDGYLPGQPTDHPGLLFLHGFGERSADGSLESFLREMYADAGVYTPTRTVPFGVLKYLWEGIGYRGIIISPQCVEGTFDCEKFTPGIGLEALRHAAAHYPLDTSRVVVSGVSYGGTGAYNFAAAYPTRVVATAPVAMGGTAHMYAGRLPGDCPLGGVEVWAFHNATDTNATTLPDNTIDLVTASDACGTPASAWLYYIEGAFTVPAPRPPRVIYVPSQQAYYSAWPDNHHSGDDETYDNPDFWNWVWTRLP